mmetsp:Transcript_4497/g.11876  ORF Transcript_4497/g.11876 Transcript_4497/m.11876 type:complete len:376 (-) Transcript_4497:281-1408(-)
MEPSKLSYRQAGKSNAGTLMRGKLSGQGGSGKNFSTIPSKFETTLFTGNKERDGFGSRAHRFVDIENDLPGPGTYEEHAAKLSDDKVYSKKGLGVGFVSKTKRASGFGANSAAPGPGSYERGGSFAQEAAERNRSNRSGSTSTFKPPSTRSVVVSSDPQPGPGNYELPRAFDAAQTAAALQRELHPGSMFKSVTQRGGAKPGSRGMPGPGQYEPPLSTNSVDPALPSAAFRSGVPMVGQSAAPRLTREQQLGVVAYQPSAIPGPGDYELPSGGLPHGGGIRRRMPQFCDSNHDRFGKPLSGPAPSAHFQVPGPGSYVREDQRETAVISSAVFMSGTNRSGAGGRDPVPGPAYYSPAPNARKTFHLNARQRWVPSL